MAPPVMNPADRLSRLPDEILADILSFLPAQEAVRTCVLGRTWRDVREFVDRLLRFRLNRLECASVDACEIMFHIYDDYDTQFTVNQWIRRSLECQVQALRVEGEGLDAYLMMNDWHLISRHLTKLELHGVLFDCNLNLDGCPALEHLEINDCFFASMTKIMSPSLKGLVITRCGSNVRFKVSAPCLVSLWLEVDRFRAPFLDSMPDLVEAHVRIDSEKYWDDDFYHDDPMGCHHVTQAIHTSDGDVGSDTDEDREGCPGPNIGCVLLGGLARPKHLVLLAHHAMYIFRRDLRMCPTFSNLKTLVLNGYWCDPDCRPLACIIKHAPVLENLIVIYSEEVELKYDIVLEGCPDATTESTMTTQCLETVKVKCHTIDEGVQNVLKFLSTLNICFNLE